MCHLHQVLRAKLHALYLLQFDHMPLLLDVLEAADFTSSCSSVCVVHLLCRQARKLQEMFKALQQENEDLKRRLSGGGRSMPGGMLGAAGAGQLSGRTGQRSPFGAGAGTQMVS